MQTVHTIFLLTQVNLVMFKVSKFILIMGDFFFHIEKSYKVRCAFHIYNLSTLYNLISMFYNNCLMQLSRQVVGKQVNLPVSPESLKARGSELKL